MLQLIKVGVYTHLKFICLSVGRGQVDTARTFIIPYGYTATGVELSKELIVNPRAVSPLSADTQRVIAAFGDDWPYRLTPN